MMERLRIKLKFWFFRAHIEREVKWR
jgi:hypothetical protein